MDPPPDTTPPPEKSGDGTPVTKPVDPDTSVNWVEMNLNDVENELAGATQLEEEVGAMIVLAQRDNMETKQLNATLKEENSRLRALVEQKRRYKKEQTVSLDFADVYDWIVDITMLSDVSKDGWRVEYSQTFLDSMLEAERKQFVDSNQAELDFGWDGAVVAVLGLFDKGKTFVLNHLTEEHLPSGKKVTTKGLSFKHVNVDGTKFIILDSEGSYSPVKVENDLSVLEKETAEMFIQDVIFEIADYFLCVVNDFTSLDQRYLDKLTRNLQQSKKAFREVIVVHNCKMIMEKEVLDHIWETQVTHIYGSGIIQNTKVAAVNSDGILEEKNVQWFKTNYSRHIILAHEDCELGQETNPWTFSLLRYWLKGVFVPVNRKFSVMDSVLHYCNVKMSNYFKNHPKLVVSPGDRDRIKYIKSANTQEEMRLPQVSIDASGLMLTRPDSFQPQLDIIKDKAYTIYMDVPGLTKDDIKLSRQNVTTIIKGGRSMPYHEKKVRVERAERKYGDFTQTFKIPEEYERKWSECTVECGVLKMVFRRDDDEENMSL